MEKSYNPQDIEQSIYKKWEEGNYFSPTNQGDPYCIVLPPPNVTGNLHMGHAFQDTLMDILVRYHRMKGDNTMWQVGTDHAGIATQMVVERQLAAKNTSRVEIGREAFVEKVQEWKETSGNNITRQLRRLGVSADWDGERFTMDEHFCEAVKKAFVDMYEENLIYRGKRLVNWDPKLHTAISDLEVENKECKGQMWQLRYPLADGVKCADGKDYIVVSTTRPETMLGDTAVAVNPEDDRFKHLIGKFVVLPLVNRKIPIIGDEHADMEKGTGCVKITPGHDFNDYEVGKRHNLTIINVLTFDAKIRQSSEVLDSNGEACDAYDKSLPDMYIGMDRYDARKAIVEEFERQGLLEGVKEHDLMLPYGDRSSVVIEPMLTDQWYMRVSSMAEQAVKVVEDGDIEFVPKQYENMYFAWMRDVRDWCISRQLWWGHRIPAWYDEQGNVFVGNSEQAVREKHNLSNDVTLRQDDDVLDTWFSAGMWTFVTMGWPEKTSKLETFHPSSVLVTGFDIIFFWVARMIMMTMKFVKDDDGKPQVPFKKVYVTGLIRDENGDKMSKSKGNVLDPIDMIDGIDLETLVEKRTGNMMQPHLAKKIAERTRKQFPDGIEAQGTDALRFTLAMFASTGRDINWDMSRLEGNRNFCNKIWNASRYVMLNTENKDCGVDGGEMTLSLADKWIVGELQKAIANFSENVDNFRFDMASQTIYEFVWTQFCDWYLELTKPTLFGDDEAALRGTRHTLLTTLETLLRLIHPIMPFISETIWQQVSPMLNIERDTIMTEEFPICDKALISETVSSDMDWVKKVIVAVRNIRGEMNISPTKTFDALLNNVDAITERRLNENKLVIMKLAKLSNISVISSTEGVGPCATALVDKAELLVPMADLIDKEAELARLNKQLEKLVIELKRTQGKLENPNFVDKAPEEVVNSQRKALEQMLLSEEKITAQITQLEEM